MNKLECTYYKSMKSWEVSLENADQSDTDRIAYLTEKRNAAAAIVAQREYLGIYNK